MPWCPVCRYEYQAGIKRCPEDDVELVDERPPKPKLGEAIEVYRSSNIAAVDAVALWLAEHGYQAEVIDRPAGGTMGSSPTFAVTLDSESAEAVAPDLDAAIKDIEAEVAVAPADEDDEEEEEEDLVEAAVDDLDENEEEDEDEDEEEEEEDLVE
jgi:hypothetical protein